MTTLPTLITVEEFFGPPTRSRAQLSPDGTKVAYLGAWRNRLNVFVRDLDGAWPETAPADDAASRRVTSDDHRSIDTFFWTTDSRYLLFTQDTRGDENAHLHRIDPSRPGEPTIDLTPIDGARVLGTQLCADRPETVVVQLNARRPDLVDLHELDLDTARLTMLAENPGDVVSWLRTPGGRILAFGMADNGDHLLSNWNDSDQSLIARFSGLDHPFGVLPCMPTTDGTGLWIGSPRGTDRTRLVRLDLDSGTQTRVDSHPVFDLDTPRPEADPRFPSSLILNPATGELLGARYLGARQEIHALDPLFAEVLPQLAELSDGDLAHMSATPPHSAGSWTSPTTATPASPGSTTTPPARHAACSARSPTWTQPSWHRSHRSPCPPETD